MLCEFERLVYPKELKSSIDGYMVVIYRLCDKIIDMQGNEIKRIKAVGYSLPVASNVRYELQGKWSRNHKHGTQFEVESCNEVIAPTKKGITAYLSSGQINGIGPKLAGKIFDRFGLDSLKILDENPEKLLEISGISSEKLRKICDSYLANRGARDVVAFLTPHGITPNRAVQIYKVYGNNTLKILKNNPYKLCEITGIGFKTADRIALSLGFEKMSPLRIDAGLIYTLTNAEEKGHLCIEKHEFINKCLTILDTPELTYEAVGIRGSHLVHNRKLVIYNENVYKPKTSEAEHSLAVNIYQCLINPFNSIYENLESEICNEGIKQNIKMAEHQKSAVKMALSNKLSVITGGPGTGKTLIQRIILNIYSRNNPGKEICCCAPTGRAARRMKQSTGHQASTVHKALGIMSDDEICCQAEALDADLIIVDEASMLDIYIANRLFKSVKKSAQIVLIGDADQLPSVGPGMVLNEIITCGFVPVIRLDKVYRQSSGSRIAFNANLIRNGITKLEYGSDFQFYDSIDISSSADTIINLYIQEISVYGLDNVALLTPFRQKTDTSVNTLNTRIRDLVNPSDAKKPELSIGKRSFRCGDKVMQIKNHMDINNGDIGYIKDIFSVGNEKIICIDFGEGRLKEYNSDELDMLDLGYASTIHKSQGSEYSSVIINLQCAHYIMLTRPLLYTAVTRGKTRVIIVGERKALYTAINRIDINKRGTCLALRINDLERRN